MDNECVNLSRSYWALAAAVSLFGPERVSERTRQRQIKDLKQVWWACRCRLDNEEDSPVISVRDPFLVNHITGASTGVTSNYRSKCVGCRNILLTPAIGGPNCHLRFCPLCWVASTSRYVCNLLIENAKLPESKNRSLVWLRRDWEMRRFGNSESELDRAIEFLRLQVSPAKLEGLDLLLDRSICGRISLFNVEPVAGRWLLQTNHLLLVPRLTCLPVFAHCVGEHWRLSKDWTYAGLSRLAGLVTRYPRGWLNATATEWRAIQTVWRGARILRTIGDFRR